MSSDEPLDSYIRRYNKIYDDESHPPGNKEILDKYLQAAATNKKSIDTQKQRYEFFMIFSKWCTKPIENITPDDIDEFLKFLSNHTYKRKKKEYKYSVYTVQTYRIMLKQFFKSEYFKPRIDEDVLVDIPAIARHMIRNTLLQEARDAILDKIEIYTQTELASIDAEDKNGDIKEILEDGDIISVITNASSERDAMMIAVLYEAGCRKGELRRCQVKHLKFEPTMYKLTFPKTKRKASRTIELVFSRYYVDQWLLKHPQKLPDGTVDPEAYLIISTQNPKVIDGREIYTPLTTWGIAKQIRGAAKRAGVTKPVNPHNFRASRATHLSEDPNWTEQQIKEFQGWDKDSKMLSHYVRKTNTKNAVCKTYGLPVEEPDGKHTLKVTVCPNCHQPIPEAIRDRAQHCVICGYPLTAEAHAKQKDVATDALMELIRLAMSDPDLYYKMEAISKMQRAERER